MIQLVLVLIINILFLMGWGRLLKYLDVFKENKNIEHQIFRFVMTGNILSMVLIFIIYPFWQTIIPDFTFSPLLLFSIEEVLRFILFIALTINVKSIDKPLEGIILAVSAALGFAMGENFIYVLNSGISVFLYNSFFGLLGHIAFSLIWGSVLSVIFSTAGRAVKSNVVFYTAAALIVSVLLHGTYNSLLFSGRHWYALIVVLITLTFFLSLYRYLKESSANKKFPVNSYRSAVLGLQIGGR